MQVWRVKVCFVVAALGCARAPVVAPAAPADAANDVADLEAAADAKTAVAVDVAADASAVATDAADVAAPPVTQCPASPLPDWATSTVTPGFWPSALCAQPGWTDPPSAATLTFTPVIDGFWASIGPIDPCVLWEDLDGDGKEDFATVQLPLTATGPRHLLVVLDAAGAEVPISTPLPPLGMLHDCVAGDLDGDGLPEIVLGADVSSRILRNLGAGNFADTTEAWQAQAMLDVPLGTVGMFDADRDGDLDLYLGQLIPGVGVQHLASSLPADVPYLQMCVDAGPPSYDEGCASSKAGTAFAFSCCLKQASGAPNLVLRNDGGHFVDTSAAWGLADPGNTLALSIADLDGDGWEDVFVGNDFGKHGWYRNNGGGPFTHLSGVLNLRPYGHVMGSAIGDFDGDHRADLLISEAGPTTYYKAMPQGFFSNEGGQSGLWAATGDSLSWALAAADLDQDGWLDVAQMRSLVAADGGFAQAIQTGQDPQLVDGSHLVLHNQGFEFKPLLLPWPIGAVQTVQAAAVTVADVDGDGDLDLVTATPPGILQVYLNDSKAMGHWLRVRLGGPAAAAEGAHVQVWASGYAQERVRATTSGTGSKLSSVLHFGLGSVKKLDLVRVTWSAGQQVELKNVDADQTVVVTPP